MTAKACDRLVVIPTNPFSAYEKKGLENLFDYYNPNHLFKEVYAVSPLEQGVRFAHGLHIVGTTWRGFKTTVESINPQAVRAYGGYWAADLAVYSKIPGVPIVVSVHDAPPVWPHASVRYADCVICMSKVVAQAAERCGVDSARIRIIPNRVDLDTFHPARGESSPVVCVPERDKTKVVLHVGRLEFQKNQETLIGALAHLPEEYHVYFVGQGKKGRYLARARECGVASRCHWLDSVPNSQLPSWYNSCDCFCTPSRFEGFGIVFIEAAACGCPIVTSDISPMNEYLEHGVSAHLIKEHESPEALAEAIAHVCTDGPYQRRLRQGAVLAARRFDKAKIDKEEADLYLDVIGQPSRVFSVADHLGAGHCFWRHRVADASVSAFWTRTAWIRNIIKTGVQAFRER
jgi:glycosyltransferase involved in cell wall biosynthesis